MSHSRPLFLFIFVFSIQLKESDWIRTVDHWSQKRPSQLTEPQPSACVFLCSKARDGYEHRTQKVFLARWKLLSQCFHTITFRQSF